MLELRNYQSTDCKEIMALFYHTVHTVNAKDYRPDQLDAWAPQQMDDKAWDTSLKEHFTIVAVQEGIITGFGDIRADGYLDRLYVHAAFQGRGIGSAICDRLEEACTGKITTAASLTARSFFAGRGYQLVRAQEVERKGVKLKNFLMVKQM
jgi:putative acetyltransferase